MGSLNLPAFGQVYFETNTLIYTVEHHPRYGPLLDPFWQAVLAGQVTPISSALIITEALVMPLRNGDLLLQGAYETALFSADLQLVPLSQDILREAARLRADIPGLRTPDARCSSPMTPGFGVCLACRW
jgi:hypothetical protein